MAYFALFAPIVAGLRRPVWLDCPNMNVSSSRVYAENHSLHMLTRRRPKFAGMRLMISGKTKIKQFHFLPLCLKIRQLFCSTLFCCKTKYSREIKSVKNYFTLFSAFCGQRVDYVWTMKIGAIVHVGIEARRGFWLFVDNWTVIFKGCWGC